MTKTSLSSEYASQRFPHSFQKGKVFWGKERLNHSLRVEIKCSAELQQFMSEFKNI